MSQPVWPSWARPALWIHMQRNQYWGLIPYWNFIRSSSSVNILPDLRINSKLLPSLKSWCYMESCVSLYLFLCLLFTVILSTLLYVSQTRQDVSYLEDSAWLLFMPQSILPSPFLHMRNSLSYFKSHSTVTLDRCLLATISIIISY